MAGIDTDFPSHPCVAYNSAVDLELPIVITRASFSRPIVQTSPPIASQLQLGQGYQNLEMHQLPKLETTDETSFEDFYHNQGHLLAVEPQLHLSDLDLTQTWTSQCAYPQLMNNSTGHVVDAHGLPLLSYTGNLIPIYPCFDDACSQSPWSSSSPGYAHCRSLARMDNDEDAADDKPYARLIYDALMQAPGHRMMLREIYDWFRQYTTKPQESGSNGWQNSIRHNLSMNKAFENDRETAKGGSKKATSVWILTEDAIKNGVQSTTRYRKTGGGKKSMGARAPAIQRQKAGAKGGRAARNSAKRRHYDHFAFTDPMSMASPSTTSYSDYGDYQSLDYHELRPTVRSWPMTPVDDHLALGDSCLYSPLSPPSALNPTPQPPAYAEESMYLQNALLESMRDRHSEGLIQLAGRVLS